MTDVIAFVLLGLQVIAVIFLYRAARQRAESARVPRHPPRSLRVAQAIFAAVTIPAVVFFVLTDNDVGISVGALISIVFLTLSFRALGKQS